MAGGGCTAAPATVFTPLKQSLLRKQQFTASTPAVMQEGMDAQLLKWNDRVISVDLPKNVELQVVETDPGVKGNTQSGALEGCSAAMSCW
jgi:hypothetical protein